MKSTALLALSLVATALVSTPALAATPADGTWDLVADTQMGKLQATMTVGDQGGAVTVSVVDAPMAAPEGAPAMPPMASTISDVAFNGGKLTFTRSFTGEMAFVLRYELTVTGDSLAGKAGSDFGDSAVTGTRRK